MPIIPVNVLSCIYRGPEIRQDPCASCNNRVRIRVFSCQKFGECTLKGPQPAKGKICRVCNSRVPLPAQTVQR